MTQWRADLSAERAFMWNEVKLAHVSGITDVIDV